MEGRQGAFIDVEHRNVLLKSRWECRLSIFASFLIKLREKSIRWCWNRWCWNVISCNVMWYVQGECLTFKFHLQRSSIIQSKEENFHVKASAFEGKNHKRFPLAPPTTTPDCKMWNHCFFYNITSMFMKSFRLLRTRILFASNGLGNRRTVFMWF